VYHLYNYIISTWISLTEHSEFFVGNSVMAVVSLSPKWHRVLLCG